MHFLNGIKRGKHLKRREARSTLQTQHSIDTLAALQILHSSHSPLHAPHLTLHTSLSTLQTPSRLHTPHSTLQTPHSAISIPHSTLHTLHSALPTLHSTPYSTFHILHSTPTLHYALRTPHRSCLSVMNSPSLRILNNQKPRAHLLFEGIPELGRQGLLLILAPHLN